MLKYIKSIANNGSNQKKLLKKAKEIKSIASKYPANASQEDFGSLVKNLKSTSDLEQIFAAIVVAAKRSIGLTPYDVQIAGALAMSEKAIAQMQTGEGKTLTAAMAAASHALQGKKVHLATVNDYLAGRDTENLRKFYTELGLTVGHAAAGLSREDKLKAYSCNVVYVTAQELGFDYLRDHLVEAKSLCVQGDLDVMILDEADSILIDEASTPLILSGIPEDQNDLYNTLNILVDKLEIEEDFAVDRKEMFIDITDAGHDKIEDLLRKQGLLVGKETLHDLENLSLAHAVTSTIAAKNLYRRDMEYMVKDGQIIIIDENTGRAMKGRRWSDGIHQAIEAKEGLKVHAEAPTLASITYQGFFRLYKHLSGLTGTAETDADEFEYQYALKVVVIPTHRPIQRIDEHDRVYATDEARNKAIIKEVIESTEKGQPVLIGTPSVESSEALAEALRKHNLEPAVLNARYHDLEAKIIAEAGRPGAITIATQMAGRGTDIMLGGTMPNEAEDEMALDEWKVNCKKVIDAGGLYVIGTSRASSRRVDRQLRGRSGRQGDPGRSCFFLSLEDEFIQNFAKDKLEGLMSRFEVQDEALEGQMMDRIVKHAQETRESIDRQVRQELMKYDNVLAKQRATIYSIREEWLDGLASDDAPTHRNALIERMIHAAVDGMCQRHLPGENDFVDEWNPDSLLADIAKRWNLGLNPEFFDAFKKKPEGVPKYLLEMAKAYYKHRKTFIDERVLGRFESVCILEGLDKAWLNQQQRLTMLRDGIDLRTYANVDTKVAFQNEAGEMFGDVLEEAYEIGAQVLLGAHLPGKPQSDAA